jgi:hypothetical protein
MGTLTNCFNLITTRNIKSLIFQNIIVDTNNVDIWKEPYYLKLELQKNCFVKNFTYFVIILIKSIFGFKNI